MVLRSGNNSDEQDAVPAKANTPVPLIAPDLSLKVELLDVKKLRGTVGTGDLIFTGLVDFVELKRLQEPGVKFLPEAFMKALGVVHVPAVGRRKGYQRNPFGDKNRLFRLLGEDFDPHQVDYVKVTPQPDGKTYHTINGLGRIIRYIAHGYGTVRCEVIASAGAPLGIRKEADLFVKLANSPKKLTQVDTIRAGAVFDPRSTYAQVKNAIERGGWSIEGRGKRAFTSTACIFDALRIDEDAEERIVKAFELCHAAWPTYSIMGVHLATVYGILRIVEVDKKGKLDTAKFVQALKAYTPGQLVTAAQSLTISKVTSNAKPRLMAQALVAGGTAFVKLGGYNRKLKKGHPKIEVTDIDRSDYFRVFAQRQATNHERR